jgi:rod shape-determining protein MreB
MYILGIFAEDLAIDLGTANTLIYIKGKGVVLDEPSMVALAKRDSSIRAVGKEAKEMFDKTPEYIETIRPLRDGSIADYEVTEQMVSSFIKQVMKKKAFKKPRMLISVHSGCTSYEKKVIQEIARHCNARKVCFLPQPMAAAIGANIPIQGSTANMIIDIGGGTTEVAIIASSAIAHWEAIKIAGDEMDEEIQRHIRKKCDLDINLMEAERLKKEIGSAISLPDTRDTIARGKDIVTELPKAVKVDSELIRESLKGPLKAIADLIITTLEHIPAALAADIQKGNIMLAGGGSLLEGLDIYLFHEIGHHFIVAEDPLRAVVNGSGVFLEDPLIFEDVCLN